MTDLVVARKEAKVLKEGKDLIGHSKIEIIHRTGLPSHNKTGLLLSNRKEAFLRKSQLSPRELNQ